MLNLVLVRCGAPPFPSQVPLYISFAAYDIPRPLSTGARSTIPGGGGRPGIGMASPRVALLWLLTCVLLLGASSSLLQVEATPLLRQASLDLIIRAGTLQQQLVIGQWTLTPTTPFGDMQAAAQALLGARNNTEAMINFVEGVWVGDPSDAEQVKARCASLVTLLQADLVACAARARPPVPERRLRFTMDSAKTCKDQYHSCRAYGVDVWCGRCARGCLVFVLNADGACSLAPWALKYRNECAAIPRGPLTPPPPPEM